MNQLSSNNYDTLLSRQRTLDRAACLRYGVREGPSGSFKVQLRLQARQTRQGRGRRVDLKRVQLVVISNARGQL